MSKYPTTDATPMVVAIHRLDVPRSARRTEGMRPLHDMRHIFACFQAPKKFLLKIDRPVSIM